MTEVTLDERRFRERFDEFNEIGATEAGGVDRPALSDENERARDLLVEWFRDADLDVRVDRMGNVFGRREGREPEADAVLFGSHVDSQYNGGRFDGVIGVLGALEVVEALDDAGVVTDRPLEIVSWSNEEGVRFQPDMLGSGVYAGQFDLEYALGVTDDDGETFEEELERIGYDGDAPCEPDGVHCYFELHVEQGPYLEDAGVSVGVVEGVFGFSWMNVAFEGQANHAGPTPMHMRRDAFVGTADVAKAVREMTATGGADLVGTVGSVNVWPNAINVVPERVAFTVDVRSYDNDVVCAADREGLEFEFEEIMRLEASAFDADCIETVADAAADAGCEYERLVSGAGHDASYLNEIAPTSMIFVPSVDGVSHRESEFTEWADVVAGAEVLLRAVREQAAI